MASHADHRRITPTGIATAGVLVALMLLALCTWGASAAQAGTLVITKGGDRNVASNSFTGATNYAQNLAGAEFEYSSSAAGPWTTVPGTTGANGQVSTVLSAGIYYVREKTPAPGFTNFGPLQSVSFGNSAQQYTARVEVENTGTTYAHPHTNTSGTPGNWTPTNDASSSNNGSPFLDVRDNGTVPDTCGQNILLVLDRSGSIDDYRQSYEAAAKAFVNQMNGTPTQIGILSFNNDVNSYSPSQGSSSYYQSPLDLSNPGSATTLNSTISNIYDNPSGSTNWDEALQAAAAAKGFTANASTGQTSNPDMVVFITDGNPTTSPIDGGGFGSSTTLQNLSGGIASANLVKNQTSRPGQKLKMLAIGVGSGVTADNLKVVSGPVQGVNGDYAVPTIPELDAFLSELAAKQCGARVYVRKRIAGDNTNQAGWKYTAVDPRPGHTPTYLDNNNATHSSGNPPVVQTGAFFTSLPTGPTTVQVNENAAGQPVSNFSLTSVVCRDDGYDGGQVVPGTQNGLNYSLDVNRGDEVYCTYTNAVNTTLSISKTPDNQTINAGDDAEFTITVTNTGGNTASAALVSDQLPAPGVGGWTVSQQPAGGNCTVNGSNLLGCTLGDIPAGQSRTIKVKTGTDEDHCAVYDNPAAKASASNASEVTDAGKITCQKPSLEVTKTATSGTINAGEDAEFSVTLKNNGPGVAKGASLSDPLPGGTAGPWTIVSQPAGDPCSITAGTLNCAFGDLAAGQDRTVVIKAGTSYDACTTYDNTATVTSDNAGTDNASARVICDKSDLGVLKTAVHATISAGDNAEFTIVTSNTGAGTAKDVEMTDQLPTGVSGPWTITNQPAGDPCSISGNTLTCNFGDMSSGASYSVTVSAPTDFDSCTTLDNTATATSTNAPDDSDDASIDCQKPNLSVTKTAENATINAGDTARFTIKVANGGPGVAKGVSLSDPLPAGTDGWVIDSQPAGDPCSIAAGTLSCANLGDLAAGADVTIVISAPTSFQNCATYDNTATASSSNAPDASDGDTITCRKPSLEVTKTATNGTISAGDPAGYSITMTNYGPGTAKNASLSDPLPAGTGGWTIVSQPAGNPCSITGGTLSCTFGDLAAGQDRTVTLTATTSYQNCATWNNTATGSADNSPDATDSATITCQKPSLEVTKTATSGTINAGEDAEFSVTLKNNGPGVAKSPTLSDPLPTGTAGPWTIVSQPAGNPCSITAGTLACAFSDLASGQSQTVTVKAPTSAQACATYSNTATGSAANAPSATGSATINCQKPSLAITKTAAAANVNAGDDIQFTVKVSNAGPGTASNVNVSDPLPGGTQGAWTIVSQPAGDPCSITAGTLNCAFGDLAAGQDRTVVIKAGTSYDACTTYDNTATVTSDNAGTDNASARVICDKSDLGVLKTAVHATISAGDNAEFTIVTSNTGAGTAKDVEMTDQLPTGVSGPWTITNQPAGDPCSISGNTLTCNFGDMSSGASYSVTVSAPTDFDSCTTLDNTATATSTNAPDDSDDASIDCQKPNLSVTKTAENATINAGDTARFTIKVANGGPGVAKGVSLSDPLPAGTDGWVIDSQPAGDPCSIAAGTLSCANLGDLAAGADVTIVISAPTSFQNCATYDNTATASSSNAPDASDGDTITCQKPDLEMEKTGNGPINAGEDAIFTIKLTNNGPGVAKNASLSDPLPAGTGGWTIDPANPDCSITAGTLNCDFGDLAAGTSKTVTVKASTSVEACATWDNTATGSADNSPDATGSASIACQNADVGVLKTAVHATINAGENAEFTIVTSNAGPGVAKDVQMTDPLPAGVSGAWTITDQPAGDPCSITAGTLTCNFGDMASGASYSVTVSAPTDFDSCTTLDNTATATSTNADGDSDQASINCQKPNLSVTKTADNATINAGEDAAFTIRVENAGPGTAKAVTLNDPLPAGTAGPWTIVSQPAGDPCSITAGTLTCDFGDLAADASAEVKISAPTSHEDCTAYDNTATTSSSNAPDASDEARIVCEKPDLATLKTAVQGTISAGDTAEYTIEVSNSGPGVAKGVTLHDPLPAGTSGDWTITDQPAGDPCSITAGTLNCDFGDMAAGVSRSVTVSAPTSFDNCSTLLNKATASGDNAADADGSATINCQKPNLTVQKNGNGTVNAGEDVEFTITVANGGPGVARNVTLSDSVPSGVADAWTISSQPAGDPCSITAGVLDCDFGDMNAETSHTVTIVAPTDFEHCATYDNTATASAGNSPDASDSDTVNCLKPDVGVTKTGSGRTGIGMDLSFTIKVTNNGEGTAKGVVVDDPLSDLAGPWSIDSQSDGAGCQILDGANTLRPAGTVSGPRLFCDIGDLESGESIEVTIRARMNNSVCRPVENIATVTSENAPEATADATVKCIRPRLQLRKKANHRAVLPGQRVRYTILVRNRRLGSVATNLRVCDRIPPKMTVVNQGSGHFANGLLCWKIDRLEGSKQWTRMHYVTRVDQTANGGEHLRNVVTLRKLRAQWTVRVKNPPVRQRRRHHSRVTG